MAPFFSGHGVVNSVVILWHLSCVVIFTDVKKEEMVMSKQETDNLQIDNNALKSSAVSDVDNEVNSADTDAVKVDDAVQFVDDVKLETDALKDRQSDADDVTDASKAQENVTDAAETQVTSPLCGRVCQPVLILVSGWRTYARQSAVFAGISLALLYMTVLGFDSITVGELLRVLCEHSLHSTMTSNVTAANTTNIKNNVYAAVINDKIIARVHLDGSSN